MNKVDRVVAEELFFLTLLALLVSHANLKDSSLGIRHECVHHQQVSRS